MATLVIRPDSVTSSSGFADSCDGLRDKINDYVVNVFDKAHEEPYKNQKPKKTYKDNVITVSFDKSDKC